MEYESITILIRLILAAFLAGVIGIERESKGHPAGFRTHMLVGTGSCLVMLLALFGFQDYLNQNGDLVAYDPSRLASYVISGIGFLGAGTIIVQGASIRGLTTAASIWIVAAIGLTIGAGMFFAGIAATVLVLTSLIFLSHVDKWFKNVSDTDVLFIAMDKKANELGETIQRLESMKVQVQKIKGKEFDNDEALLLHYYIKIQLPDGIAETELYQSLYKIESIKEIELNPSYD
ncbi:putative Mg2+ transporter-C (MgtC) family protein [Marinococcus luteus]|uniref:Putative Mg2+ transporter-C (MgtC) family protein n=2 Tax=Marinococcus luteus TaxID=1122204 RepID=A0A1H2Y3W4_9BACI|nr:putative Mg2+ transporter-C (MgtC) family protein [Marinococcus luteus]